jgi:hypothetical protein
MRFGIGRKRIQIAGFYRDRGRDMARRKKVWTYSPPKKRKPTYKIPETLKDELEQKAEQIIEDKFKPYRLKLDEGAKEKGFNYVVEIYTKWWRNYFYFCCKFHCLSPRAIREYFEDPFTRMEYVGGDRFNLSYMRHTEQWWPVYSDLTLEEALKIIEEEIIFWP